MKIDFNDAVKFVYEQTLNKLKKQELTSLPDQDILFIIQMYGQLNQIDLEQEATQQILSRVKELVWGIQQTKGIFLDDDEFEPWVDNESIKFNYFNRYEELLRSQLPVESVATINAETLDILERIGNPKKPGEWSKRGMVIGHVQSGKTGNFVGLINRATDAGYKFIIVLAGMQNVLRKQTQERIEEGFIGQSTSNIRSTKATAVGVGLLFDDLDLPCPKIATSQEEDFKPTWNYSIHQNESPTILVVKKNSSVLRQVLKWIERNLVEDHQDQVSKHALLMIDDEADQASLNTKDEDKDDEPTAINRGIRKILATFKRKSYVAYTATPFANIFVNPEAKHESFDDDLFPKDFILNLNTPDNYFGPHRVFHGEGSSSPVRLLEDLESYVDEYDWLDSVLPDQIVKHKKDHEVTHLPQSLKQTILSHIISKSIRLQRIGQEHKHHSMMVHISRFTNIQNQFKSLILIFVQDLQKDIELNASLNLTDIP
ncbi:MAG: hypothetical protein HRT88_10460, partial [Lentisphaeraceae bacterium]|nr:hypothetical protein [Lentisphaeraceae bacterium]